jgi:hypothetical protein
MLHRPHPKVKDVIGLSRLVTLPDWQGLGLAMVLSDALGAAYKAIGKRMHTYPAHPSLIRSYDHSPKWAMVRKPGFSSSTGLGRMTQSLANRSGVGTIQKDWTHGSRHCAIFEYIGDALNDRSAAEGLIHKLNNRSV